MVDTCEDASNCLERLVKENLSDKLLDETDSFAGLVGGNTSLRSYIARGRRLQRTFEVVYKEATTADPLAEVKRIGMLLIS